MYIRNNIIMQLYSNQKIKLCFREKKDRIPGFVFCQWKKIIPARWLPPKLTSYPDKYKQLTHFRPKRPKKHDNDQVGDKSISGEQNYGHYLTIITCARFWVTDNNYDL